MSKRVGGPLSTLGFALAALVFGLDQTLKYALLQQFNTARAHEVIRITPFFELRLVWNYGISYGFFATHNQGALIAFSLFICVMLWVWLTNSKNALTASGLGLIIGGALSNACDRVLRGAVVDFFYFHWDRIKFTLVNFIFNPADVAIVAGVLFLLYEALKER